MSAGLSAHGCSSPHLASLYKVMSSAVFPDRSVICCPVCITRYSGLCRTEAHVAMQLPNGAANLDVPSASPPGPHAMPRYNCWHRFDGLPRPHGAKRPHVLGCKSAQCSASAFSSAGLQLSLPLPMYSSPSALTSARSAMSIPSSLQSTPSVALPLLGGAAAASSSDVAALRSCCLASARRRLACQMSITITSATLPSRMPACTAAPKATACAHWTAH